MTSTALAVLLTIGEFDLSVSYTLGHLLAWFSIALLIRLPDLSTWAVLLVFFWPIADTFFAIYRRRRAGRPTDMPDRLHYHQLVMRALEITLIGRNRRNVANPLATLVILPLASAPVIAGVLLWNKPLEAFFAICVFSALFVFSYIVTVKSLQAGRLPFGRRDNNLGLQPAKVLVQSEARKRVG